MIIVDGVVGKTLIQIYLLKSAINQEEHGLNQQMNLIILIITFLILCLMKLMEAYVVAGALIMMETWLTVQVKMLFLRFILKEYLHKRVVSVKIQKLPMNQNV